jgi:prepilin peptidase CpaA
MDTAQYIAFPCALLFTAAGMVCDVRLRKLPNWLTAPTFCAGLVFHAIIGLLHTTLWHGLSGAFGGFAVGFGLLWVLWLIGGAGGGDVKFMGALGCWLGAWPTLQILVLSALLAVALTGLMLLTKKKKQAAWRVPYGVPVAISTWWLLGLQWAGHGISWEMFAAYFKAS